MSELTEVSPALEKQIIVRCAIDTKFRTKAKIILKNHCFSNKVFVWMWKIIVDAPVRDVVSEEIFLKKSLIEFSFNEELLDSYKLIIGEVYKQVDSSSEVGLEILEQSKNYVKLENAVYKIVDSLKNGNSGKAWEIISDLKRPEKVDGSRVDYIEDWEERQQERKNNLATKNEIIPTRFKLLDKVIGGIQFGEFGIISGATGRGKSIAAVNVAFASAVQGFNTVYFTTEMLAEQVATRFDSRVTGVRYDKFKFFDFSEPEYNAILKKIARRKRQLKNKLHIFDAKIGKCNLEYVEEKVLELQEEKGIKIHCIVIDSPDHFKSDRRYDTKRHEYADIFWNLKAMSRGEGLIEHKLAVWATTQTPQEYERKIAGIRGVSESHDKARIADILLTLNQTENQEQEKKMVINLAKFRDGESKVMFLVNTKFEIMKFEEVEYYKQIDAEGLVTDETG